jgi:uncharacterized membrane protein
MAFCNMCGTQVADGVTACPACAARGGAPPTAVTGTTSGINDNVAGLLAYVTFLPAIIFLVLEPYNKSRFVRFHSFQCLFICGASFVVHVGLMFVSVIPFLVLITLPLHLLVSLATLIALIVCGLKANQGQMYKLPVLGDLAEKQANAN